MVASTLSAPKTAAIGLSPLERQRLLQTGAMALPLVNDPAPREPKKEPKFCIVRQMIERDLKLRIAKIKANPGWASEAASFATVQALEDAMAVVRERLQPKEH